MAVFRRFFCLIFPEVWRSWLIIKPVWRICRNWGAEYLAAAFVVCARLSGRARSRAYYELCPSRSVVFRKGRQTRL